MAQPVSENSTEIEPAEEEPAIGFLKRVRSACPTKEEILQHIQQEEEKGK